MSYTPVELEKDGKTEVAETLQEEARLRWDGWLPTAAQTPPGRRRAQFAWGAGGENVWTGNLNDAHQRLPVRLPVGTTRWRLRIGNVSPAGVVETGVINFNGVFVGPAATDATGAMNGKFIAAPTQALGAFSSPANGLDFVTDWVTAPAAQFAPDVANLVSIGWTKSNNAINIRNGSGAIWYSNVSAEADDISGAGVSTVATLSVAFAISIEYEFIGQQQVGLAIGDSLTEGRGAGGNMFSWQHRAARRLGIPMCTAGAHGSQTADWTTVAGNRRWSRIIDSGIKADFAIVQLGINDSSSAVALATYQANMLTIIDNIRNVLGIKDVYVNNLAPRGHVGASANENARIAYNTWLNSQVRGTRGTFDVEAALSPSIGATALRADSDGGDGTHWSRTGHWRASQAILLPQ